MRTRLFSLTPLLGLGLALSGLVGTLWFLADRLYRIWESFTLACFQSVSFVVRAFSYAGFFNALGIVTVGLGIAWGSWFMVDQFCQHRRLRVLLVARAFRAFLPGNDTKFWNVDFAAPFAFTLGVVNPEIFISRGLLEQLSVEEAQAVLAHECRHAQRGHTARLFFWSTIERCLYFFPVFKGRVHGKRLAQEIDADQYAAKQTSQKILGRALLKVWERQQAVDFSLPTSAAGFAYAQHRIACLLGEPVTPSAPRCLRPWFATLFAGLLCALGYLTHT